MGERCHEEFGRQGNWCHKQGATPLTFSFTSPAILFLTATREKEKSGGMKSKTIISCQFVFALLASGVLFVAGCSNKDAELAAERQKELAAVRAELEQTKTSAAAQESELTRLRKDNLELLKLRNEVRQLRDDKKQLSQQALIAQAQAQAVQSQAQQAAQALAAQPAAPAARPGVPGTPEQLANACLNTLRQLDAAKQQWALENKKDATAIPTAKDLAAYLYLKEGVMLKCPAGGTYTLNPVGANPTCTIPSHALPQ